MNRKNENVELAEKRTKLANTRTFLSYIRTSLAFVSVALAFVKINKDKITYDEILFLVAGIVILIFGICHYFITNKQVNKNK